MGDLLFPFPEPDFLWVHEMYVIPRSLIVQTTDERGKVTDALPSLNELKAALSPVHGYLTAPNETKDNAAYIERQQITAVSLLPINTNIEATDLIYCEDIQLPPHMTGVYEIDTVRANISHLRVMCRRYRLQWEKYGMAM